MPTEAPPEGSAERRPSVLVPAVAVAAAALVLAYYGPAFAGYFRPQPGVYADFVQEWLSARNHWTGHPVYERQRAAAVRHLGVDRAAFDVELPWNAHPPVAVLLALPFGLVTDYPTAYAAWNALTFGLYLVGLVLIARELRIPLNTLSVAAAVALLVCWNAMHSQLFQGQLNCLLLFLLTAAWVANRRDYQTAAGVAAGVAAAAKLFPGLLLVYFAATRRWRAAAVTAATGVALNLLALAVFGPAAVETYARDVLPSLDVFRQSWMNVSLTGYWTRLGVSFDLPAAAKAVAVGCQLAVAAVVWRAGRRAADPGARDRAFAAAVFGMVLASPIAWTHYFVFLPVALAIVWRHPPRGPALAALAIGTAALWVPDGTAVVPFIGPGVTVPHNHERVRADPAAAALGLGEFPLVLTALLLVAAFARPAVPAPGHDPDGRAAPAA